MFFSDIHKDWNQLKTMMARNDVDLFICAGDWCNYRSDIVIARNWAKYHSAAKKGIEIMAQCTKPVWVLPGNNESQEEIVLAESKGLISLHKKTLEFKGLTIGSVGYTTPTPFGTQERSEKYYRKVLNSLKTDKKLDIFVSHVPPKDTLLDIVEKPPRGFTKDIGHHVGCQAIRDFINNFQPRYSFHGHMHEHEGNFEKLGNTLCRVIGKKGYILEIA
ncbi:MAG: metallophosphoesterase [Candidatus Hodarchaeota archaeon]